MRPVQIYGQFASHWSNSMVSIGIANGLYQNHVPVRVWDRTGCYVNDLSRGIETGMATTTDCIGCFVGYPHLSTQALQGHTTKVGFFITESAVIPSMWAIAAAQCDLVVVPSNWVRAAYVRGGIDPAKVLVIPHGLHPVYANVQPRPVSERGDGSADRPLRFLHIAGARDFIERKGTLQLLDAYKRLQDGSWRGGCVKENMQLVIRTPPSAQIDTAVMALGRYAAEGRVVLDYHDEPLAPDAMVRYYLRDSQRDGWTAVIQPSRAEAFGLCCLESRACGIPVILTNGHGHMMHFVDDVDTGVRCETDAAIRVNGIPNGVSPTFETEELMAAWVDLIRYHRARAAAAVNFAVGYYQEWEWTRLMKPLVKWLKQRGTTRGVAERGW